MSGLLSDVDASVGFRSGVHLRSAFFRHGTG